jgi:regulator of protease activity HflC (stomatin/prohibitin superfamily)
MSDFIKSIVKYIIMGCVGLFFFFILVTTGCTRIEPGYTGIKVNLTGTQRGAEDIPIVTGWVFYNRLFTQIHGFPTFTQNIIWSKNSDEGREMDESITFNSIEGAQANADIAISYSMQHNKIPHIFVEIRQDVDFINHNYMRSRVRDAFTRHASNMKIVDIFGAKKSELLDKVKATLNEELNKKGFDIELVAFVGRLRLDPAVEASINATISATQRAIEAQNKVVQSKAEADQQIETARGRAESVLLEAKAQAESTLVNAEAQAKANKLLTESITPELILYQAAQQWNGVTPTVMTGDAGQFLMQLQTPQGVK